MPFIKSFSINTEKKQPFPFNVPAIRFAKDIILDNSITIFTGDNGTGKSTLLESLALKLDLPLIGGFISGRRGFSAANSLSPFVEINWKNETSKGFFFRAEDFSDFVHSVQNEKQKLSMDLDGLKGFVNDSVIDSMSEGMNYNLWEMRKNYGEDMQAFSHGEACLKILETRITGKGIYLLDEPEAALSAAKQLSLIFFITETIKKGNAQFIISTHSPILMGIPKALLYEIQSDEMNQVNFEETEHYRITKTFLNNPQQYLRHL